MEKHKLSLIMPVYNVDKYLETSIVSVLNQDYKNFELIIVNDASSDSSLNIARMFGNLDDRIKIVNLRFNTIGGASVPSNIGLEYATGEYVGFVDSDDFLGPSSISKLMYYLVNTDADLCIGNFRTFGDDTRVHQVAYDKGTWDRIPKRQVINARSHPHILRLSPVPWRKVYRRAHLEASSIKFPEVDYFYEDNPLHWDVMTSANSVVLVETCVSYHRMARPGQTMAANSPQLSAFFQHIVSISQCIRKNDAGFSWGEFLHYIHETRWIVARQTQEDLASQFRTRFVQLIKDHVLPYLPSGHQNEIDVLRKRYGTNLSAPVVSFVLYFSGDGNQLENTLASIRRKVDTTFEVLLMNASGTATDLSTIPSVIAISTSGSRCKAFNQAIHLCAGSKIVFLNEGDIVADDFCSVLLDRRNAKADMICSEYDIARPVHSFAATLYDRLFLQRGSIYFGPTEAGDLSFNIQTHLRAKARATVRNEVVHRSPHSTAKLGIPHAAAEAANAVQRIRNEMLSPDAVRWALDAVSELFREIEPSVGLSEIKELELSRGYVSEQIAHAVRLGKWKAKQ